MASQTLRRWILCAPLCGALMACGGSDEAPAAQAEAAAQTAPTPAPIAPGANRAPVIESARFDPSSPRTGEPLRVVVKASDPDGQNVRFTYQWSIDGRPAQGDRDRVTLRGFPKGTPVEVVITPSDGSQAGAPYRLSARVSNQAPNINRVSIDPEGPVQAGSRLRASVDIRDQDRDSFTVMYEWRVNDRRMGERGEYFATGELKRGDVVTVRVRANDGASGSKSVESEGVQISNAAPRIVSKPKPPGDDGVFRYQLVAEDPDKDRGLTFALKKGPDGMEVDRTGGEVVWTPAADQEGTFPVVLEVRDRKGGKTQQDFELTVGSRDEAIPAAPAP